MLIVEDVTLLLLDDESGHLAGEGTLYYTLGGCLLSELALRERVRLSEPSSMWRSAVVEVVDGEELDDPLLLEALEQLAAKPRSVTTAVTILGQHTRKPVLERLAARGLVRRNEGRFLGIFPSTTWPAADSGHENDLRAVLSSVFRGTAQPDARTSAVVSMLWASGELGRVLKVEGMTRREIEARAKVIAEGDQGAKAVRDAITATNAAIIAATMAAVTAAIATTSSN